MLGFGFGGVTAGTGLLMGCGLDGDGNCMKNKTRKLFAHVPLQELQKRVVEKP